MPLRQGGATHLSPAQRPPVAFSPGGEPAATRSVPATGEPRLWTEEERAVPAQYRAEFNVAGASRAWVSTPGVRGFGYSA